MILKHGSKEYEIGKKLAEASAYRTYICTDVATGRELLLLIAKDVAGNGPLERAAYVLGELQETSDLFEAEYAKTGADKKLHYDHLFPELVDSFVSTEQGGRRVNIVAFRKIEHIRQLVPLSNLALVDGLRIDLKTSAWIMGRILKLLAFAHGEGIAIRALGRNNILIEPDIHKMVIFDWSSAQMYPSGVPKQVRKDNITTAAHAVLEAVGANPASDVFPYPAELDDASRRYFAYLRRLASSRESDAGKVHTQFYDLLNELYGRKFHPFTTLPL